MTNTHFDRTRVFVVGNHYDATVEFMRRVGVADAEWRHLADPACLRGERRPVVLLLDEYFLVPGWQDIYVALRRVNAICIVVSSVTNTGDYDWANLP